MSSQCFFCERPFVKGDHKSKYNHREYHQECFRCSTCQKPIRQAFYHLGNDEYRCADCQRRSEVNIKCARCSQSIEDGSYIEYQGKPIHANCFKCHSCARALGNALYVEHEDEPYCVPCHMDQFAQMCAVCGRSFPPGTSTRKSGEQYFHIECFRCFQCGKIILTQNYAISPDGQRLCARCA